MNYTKVDILTAAPEHPQAKVLLIYTGGTIGMVYDETGRHLIPFDFEQIIAKVPELQQFNVLLTVLSLNQPIDSSNVSINHWLDLAKIIEEHYAFYDGFVILHGTDTMAYSASALSFLLEGLAKPVIFTGAQVPIGKIRTDARENLISALEIAAAGGAEGKVLVPEVAIYFDNLLLRGNRAKKVESSHFDAFKSGNYPPLAVAGIDLEFEQSQILSKPDKPFKVHQQLDNRVAVLKLFPGISEGVVRSILKADDLRGLVLETYGAGNAPTEAWFLNALQEAIQAGLVVLNVSQCDEGNVNQGLYETSRYLEEMGIIGGADITTEAAITKLMFVLGLNLPSSETRKLLKHDLRGEISI
ncbi:asparaginase [Adhaeribacter soli]|uniref:asparaginase n=1 Tax=Adhaeribacter soli TaxID=2607655 RepID=A0A5N1J648_9BACT|nr:asparaginase [Adhaeribacter soli]KAA9345643.1 asparaginase [Adhaeribacter soli]